MDKVLSGNDTLINQVYEVMLLISGTKKLWWHDLEVLSEGSSLFLSASIVYALLAAKAIKIITIRIEDICAGTYYSTRSG